MEDELIIGGTKLEQKFSKKHKKINKDETVIEKSNEDKLDDKSMTQIEKIKKILKVFEDKQNVTLSYATKLLELFRTAMNIDQDQSNNSQHKSKQKDNKVKQKDPTENDKLVSIVLASSTTLYMQVIKVAIETLPKIIVQSFKNELNFDDVSENGFNKLKQTYRNASKTQNILMKSFIANYLKLMKSSKDIILLITFLPSIVDIIKLTFPFNRYKKSLINSLLEVMCKSYYTVEKSNDNSRDAILM